ncbi:thermonuclease family protein [Mesorhizobium sp. 8]|uniref:thermonuclease family protein n=1 Tax=Mesorhizobium sp. 8 TaxID=2584466 RepID=UPI001123FCEC|nr:thermonuclease family protein [Mesorhizobium sp. 8]QDC02641.1 thermonuclease family protein [Mesorhizobium sp. 8]
MRPAHAAAAAAILVAMSAAIIASGHRLAVPADEIVITPEDIPDMPAASETGPETGMDDGQAGDEASTEAIEPQQPDDALIRSRAIDPEFVAPPSTGAAPLERAEPRPPLSNLSLAMPPKPKMPDEWKGKPLFQPLATAAGVFQAMGYTVAISGVDAVMPDESCTDAAGKEWNCGMRARSAFRAFLRGRAPICTVPPEGGRDTISAACRIGKQDIGAWLVANGWAKAAKGGPYAKAEEVARKEHMGVFGVAPDLSNLPPEPPPVEAPVEPSPSILDLSGEPPPPSTPPPATPGFPPAPAR